MFYYYNIHDAFKAYYLTCYLLSEFKGIHSMIAEEELFGWVFDFIKGVSSREKLITYLDLTFNLNNKNLKRALDDYKEYKEEMKEYDR